MRLTVHSIFRPGQHSPCAWHKGLCSFTGMEPELCARCHMPLAKITACGCAGCLTLKSHDRHHDQVAAARGRVRTSARDSRRRTRRAQDVRAALEDSDAYTPKLQVDEGLRNDLRDKP
jgi:hypothetical protein